VHFIKKFYICKNARRGEDKCKARMKVMKDKINGQITVFTNQKQHEHQINVALSRMAKEKMREKMKIGYKPAQIRDELLV
jgi:hypothetical protein